MSYRTTLLTALYWVFGFGFLASCSEDGEGNRNLPGKASGIVSLTFEGVDYTFEVVTLELQDFLHSNPDNLKRLDGVANVGNVSAEFIFNVFEPGNYVVQNDSIPLKFALINKTGSSFDFLFSNPMKQIDPVSGAPFYPVFNLNISKWDGHLLRDVDSKGNALFERLNDFEATFEITYRVPKFDPNIEEYKSVTNGYMRFSKK
jgi:hypothetical protein